ncbi:MAG TPA: isoamylase early set domain-containing protein [Gemmatimonadales bacterium]|nr:isoamylase early set domain-containing protein [Gemmatimonadales bacterium]
MFEDRQDIVERIVSHLRRPVPIDPALDQRVMQEIATLPRPDDGRGASAVWRWLTRPRALAVSPLGALALAAGLVAVALVPPGRRASAPSTEEGARQLPFVVIAPQAARVSLIGDFNDWDAARTPMRRLGEGSAVWTTVVPLAPGRYRYAFLADGSRWLADPAAPLARDDEFGPPSSVVTVGWS